MARRPVIIALTRSKGQKWWAKIAPGDIPASAHNEMKGGYEETSNENTAGGWYAVAGVKEPHVVYSGTASGMTDDIATARYHRALAEAGKAHQDYLAARREELALARPEK